jgi:hypothetical protein
MRRWLLQREGNGVRCGFAVPCDPAPGSFNNGTWVRLWLTFRGGNDEGSRPGQPARPAIRPAWHAAGPASRRAGRELAGGTGITGHSGSADRNDGPQMLFSGRGQQQRWAIDAAGTASVGHRCGSPAPREQHRWAIVAATARQWRARARPWRGSRRPQRQVPGTGNGKNREPGRHEPALPHLTPLPSRYLRQSHGRGSFGGRP